MSQHFTPDEITGQVAACVELRRQGLRLRVIAARTGLTIQTVYKRVKTGAPGLITGEVSPGLENTNTKPKLRLEFPRWSPPATGSSSGFIWPRPLSRLMSGRA